VTAPGRKGLDDFTKLLIGLFLTPAPFEIAIGVVKGDSYDFRRLGVIVAALAVLASLLWVLRSRAWWYPQSVVGYYLVVIGLAMVTFGVVSAIWDQQVRGITRWNSGAELAISSLFPLLGMLLVMSGVFLVRDRHKRAREELDTPLPRSINSVKLIKGSWVWKSELANSIRGTDALIAKCQEYLGTKDLHFVSLFRREGDCLFYVDLFDNDALEPLVRVDPSDVRGHYVRHARHIRYLVGKLDKRLSDLDTGSLVRVILDVERGAIFYYELGTEGFLIGVTLDQEQVDPTDWKMSRLANDLLRLRGRKEDDDFYRLCPVCGSSNRPHGHAPGTASGNVVPLPRPKETGS